MANVVVNKILDFLGVPNEEPENEEDLLEENDYYDQEEQDEPEERRGLFGKKVVSMPQPQQIKMKIAKPTAFEQAEDICILLREKNAIVINLEYVNKDVARRILDVISGAVKVLDGHFEKVSNSIFIVAPFNYDIVNDMTREEIKNKLSVSWLK